MTAIYDWYARISWWQYHRTQTGERSLNSATEAQAQEWVANLQASGNCRVDALFRRAPIEPWQEQEVPHP